MVRSELARDDCKRGLTLCAPPPVHGSVRMDWLIPVLATNSIASRVLLLSKRMKCRNCRQHAGECASWRDGTCGLQRDAPRPAAWSGRAGARRARPSCRAPRSAAGSASSRPRRGRARASAAACAGRPRPSARRRRSWPACRRCPGRSTGPGRTCGAVTQSRVSRARRSKAGKASSVERRARVRLGELLVRDALAPLAVPLALAAHAEEHDGRREEQEAARHQRAVRPAAALRRHGHHRHRRHRPPRCWVWSLKQEICVDIGRRDLEFYWTKRIRCSQWEADSRVGIHSDSVVITSAPTSRAVQPLMISMTALPVSS